MKFEIDVKVLKEIINRVSVAVDKKASYKPFENIEIVAAGDAVYVKAFDSVVRADVKAPCVVYDAGSAYVNMTDISKAISNITSTVTIETKNDKLNISTGKKRSQIPCEPYEKINMPCCPEYEMLSMDIKIFSDMLNTMSPFVSEDDGFSRIALCGFYFDGKNKKIVACNSYEMVTNDIGCGWKNNFRVIIPRRIAKDIRKISNIKGGGKISVYANEKYTEIIGNDFTYNIHNIVADYVDIERIMPKTFDWNFEVSPKEICSIMKDYLQASKEPGDRKAYIIRNDESVTSSFFSCRYNTSDTFETAKEITSVPENLLLCVSPEYLNDMANIFADADYVRFNGQSNKYGNLVFTSENSNYTVLICPIKPTKTWDEIHDFISSI